MSNLVELHQRDRVREEAAIWVVRLKEGLSTRQQKKFDAWIERSPEHSVALIEIATAWDELDLVEHRASSPERMEAPQRAMLLSWKTAGLAAMVALTVLVTWFVGSLRLAPTDTVATQKVANEPANAYSTAIGEQSKVALPDGSLVSLNTNSRVVVKFSKTERRVELLQGEILLEIEPDPARPFVALAGETAVRAVGTAFSVTRKSHSLEVLVTHGKVAISSPLKAGKVDPTGPLARKVVELSAGEMAEIGSESETIVEVDEKVIENRLAWTSGMMVFDDQDLEHVIAELSRYTETTIIIGDPSLNNIRVAGYFRAGDVDSLLYALSENFDITWKEQEENLIVLEPR